MIFIMTIDTFELKYQQILVTMHIIHLYIYYWYISIPIFKYLKTLIIILYVFNVYCI